jgi:hypothetical protein
MVLRPTNRGVFYEVEWDDGSRREELAASQVEQIERSDE